MSEYKNISSSSNIIYIRYPITYMNINIIKDLMLLYIYFLCLSILLFEVRRSWIIYLYWGNLQLIRFVAKQITLFRVTINFWTLVPLQIIRLLRLYTSLCSLDYNFTTPFLSYTSQCISWSNYDSVNFHHMALMCAP